MTPDTNTPMAVPEDEAAIRASMTPEQIRVERKLTCEAIDGAIAFGRANVNLPPSEAHWLAPFWNLGRRIGLLESMPDAAPAAPQAAQKHERVRFLEWFEKELHDPNIGVVENGTKRSAAWVAWKARAALDAIPLNDGEQAAQEAASWAIEIIGDLQGLFDTDGITENDSGDALVRLSDAIATVEDAKRRAMLATPQPADGGISEDQRQRAAQIADHMRVFLRNGIELGYIRMPTVVSDPASDMPSEVDERIALLRGDRS
ncbi:hypothetical protein [Paraburkholderia kururiensis]|uniref:hypothetical protein n=1 Tax=Paraburkholderia kururiensis TaxID=984307 RepID=UPI000377170A|nr:hypothetical protein [Paraburkholderia kururiensis]